MMAKKQKPVSGEVADYGTPESFKRGAKIFILRDAKSGRAVNAKTLTYVERLERDGVIESRQRDAADQFTYHFRRAGLERYATINLFRVLGGGADADETLIHHRQQVRKVMTSLGGLQSSIIWHVCGTERPMSEWVADRNAAGFRMSADTARGVLIAALDGLAKLFGK